VQNTHHLLSPAGSSCVEAPGRRRRHFLLARPSQPPGDPSERHASPLLPFFLSPGRPSLSSPLVSLPRELTVAGARRLAPPLDATPCSSEVLRRSPSPSSASPPKQSSRGGRSSRRHRCFLARNRAASPPNSPPPARLRLSQHHQRVPGELPVLLDPSPFLFPRRSARHGWPPAVPGSRSAWAVAQPTWPGWPAYVARAPLSASVGQTNPGVKCFCNLFLFQKFQKKYATLYNS
jgi:hypothetical protein